jgi:hypothetical protein
MTRWRSLAVAALLTAAPGVAGAAEPYVGAQVLLSRTSCEGYREGFAPLGLTASCDVTSTGFRGYAGVDLTSQLGVQIGYQDAGEAHADALDPRGSLAFSTTTSLKAWDVVVTARRELMANLYVSGRVGAARWDYDVVPDRDLGGFSPSNDGTTLTYGAGVEYRWFTAGYDAIRGVGQSNLLDASAPDIKQTIHRFSLGLRYTFGR